MTDALPRRPGPTRRIKVREWNAPETSRTHEDRLAVEEPLEVRLAVPGVPARTVGVIMRTPGNDFELAAGWLVNEGVIASQAITSVAYCTNSTLRRDQEFNVVTIDADAALTALPHSRVVDSACGVCGADSISQVSGPAAADIRLSPALVRTLPDRLRAAQQNFARSGGTHGAALISAEGTVVVAREDVGRHNALDKALGHCFLGRQEVPPICVLSGRVGYELMQKAVSAGISVIVAVGAPTSLAVDIAVETGRTLVGFTSPGRFVVYAGAGRILD